MQTLWDKLPSQIARPDLETDAFWGVYEQNAPNSTIHVAILSRMYLERILNHDKTIESRFSVHRRIPYKRIKQGDVILLKESGGPICGIAYASRVWFFELENGTLQHIRTTFEQELMIDSEDLWSKYEKASYATLIELEHVKRINPIRFSKRDRNAWVIFEGN